MLSARSIAVQGIGFGPRHVALLGFVAAALPVFDAPMILDCVKVVAQSTLELDIMYQTVLEVEIEGDAPSVFALAAEPSLTVSLVAVEDAGPLEIGIRYSVLELVITVVVARCDEDA